jgi:hypothetical protein
VRRLLKFEVAEDDLEVPRVVLNRGYVVDRLSEATSFRIRQFLEGTALDIDQMGYLERVV